MSKLFIMERWARIGVIVLVLGAVAIPVGGRWTNHAAAAVEVRGRMAEAGGWTHGALEARVGEPLKLRLTSDDVVHGFAVGRHDSPEVEVMPGQWVTTSLLFERPGTYTFYCTRWCGAGHWRMRGTIEVTGQPSPIGMGEGSGGPRYVEFGIDLDAPMRAKVVPEVKPVAERGAQWASALPTYAREGDTYWSHSPAELWARLREEPALRDRTDMDLWDAVAWVWAHHITQNSTPEVLAEAAELYRREGAAAHGETGRGDGVMVQELPGYTYHFKGDGHETMRPPDWQDPYHTLGASPARLEGKMLRGGMGTGMPSYGEIYTQEQIEALVALIYTFAMDLGVSWQ
jgi:plastocyanin